MPLTNHLARMSLRTKVVVSVVAVGTAATVAGLGTFGVFDSTTTATTPVTAGTVVIQLGSAGTAANRLTLGATGLVPGDTVQRAFQLSNTGNQDLSSITLTTNASTSNLLTSDTSNGLQLQIQSCASAWTESGTSPAFTYTCSSPTTVVSSRPVIQSGLTLSGLGSLTHGGTDYLLATLTFPSTADNTFQNLSNSVTFTFVGTQRTATNR